MIKEGMIVEGSIWNEPVEIKKIEEFAGKYHIIGATIYSNVHIDQLITKEQAEGLSTKEFILDFSGKGSEAFLSIEATRFKFASLFDPLLAMNTSKIDPLPFQIEAVYGYILKLPRIRFLIADDPGAGKTIMAGLVIKELKLRGVAKRILIVVPGHLKNQWIRELKEKFQETFTVIDRGFLDSNFGENPFKKESQIITSIDFAKQEGILPYLEGTHWDLIVVDEAHKMAAYRYGGEKLSKTGRYKLGEMLSPRTVHLLFLTATPHKGDPDNYRLFMDLLSPGFFAYNDLINESIENRDNPLFIRRKKEDLKNFKGEPIFTNRYAKTIKFRLSDEEKDLYNDLSKYVISQYNLALKKFKSNSIAFALLILQRRMASSVYALLKSLERRKTKLEDLLKGSNPAKEFSTLDISEIDDYDEESRWQEENKWETLSTAESKEDLQREIFVISQLIDKAKSIISSENEVKLRELKKAIGEGFNKINEVQGNRKILIFTESKETLEYLVAKIKSWGYSVNYIHGGMKLEDRIEAEKVFKNESEIMVATEAAGEGINLQFCNLMINYDIPWNPNRLEQRMGRIHRYGQQKDVFIFNLVAEDTREGQILVKMFDKLDEIRAALGSDKVFDVIGDVFYGKNLYNLILEAVANTRSLDEIIKELDIKVDEAYIKKIKEDLGDSLATKHIDYTRIKEMTEKVKEYRLTPEYVEEFFKKAFEKAGGKFRVKKDGFIAIESVPYEIRNKAEAVDFRNQFGIILKSYPKVTFDKDIAFKNPDAEFVSFGHPLLEALLEWVSENYLRSLQRGAVFKDPSQKYNGIIWLFEGEIKDGKGETAGKRIITIYDNGNELSEVNPTIFWDFVPEDESKPVDLSIKKEKAQEFAVNCVESYKEEILKERKRQAEIKRKYGVKSLKYLINELDLDLVKLYERRFSGEDVDLAIRNKEERKKHYEQSLKILQEEIEHEESLVLSMPKLIGAVFVSPATDDSSNMVSDEEIERIGMEFVMEFEKSQGRVPEDVSKENLGFDIRSKGQNETRYIEVKARKSEGEVELTVNEWLKAKRFKENYWLYIVANALTSPTLYIINNPSENLNVQEKVEIVRFIVPIEEWKMKGEKI
ncbi:MAG: helicase-related protein [Ignavibacterium sp.]|uniref:helicase-related protein n=1 Tax=Ignavibacterium sp. TaxID=2651167 RepID=UPI00404AA590